ncbi:MAG: DEAD/DEAH box helicase [Deltaproteobacteria bacterium]|nr:DEAD/DEAH box helicase [Deltaproteobacteria bacterium]
MKFDSLDINPDILRGITDAGFEHCTPIQEQSLPECLAGKDVIAQSQTGSGKTAVFLVTIFGRLMASAAPSSVNPRALVMVPTRELATQVIDDCVKLGRHLSFRSVAVYGGVGYEIQTQALKKGVDLIVATPGRMIDLYKSKTLSLDSIEIFVIDEADRMFDMGFAPDIMYIAGRLPGKRPRQTMLFSATIDDNVRRLASRYMKPDPVMIEIEPEQVTVSSIDQKVIYVSNEEKLPAVMALLKRPDVERTIIFTNMKHTAETVGRKLVENGFPAKVLTGDLSQERRTRVIEGMKSGKIKILVATDVAARGLHIDGVSHVINFDLPDAAANYVHRVGRTARAGKSGKAYSLVCEDHVLNLPEIEKYIERKIESEWIEDSELVKDTSSRHKDTARRDKPLRGVTPFERRGKKPEPAHKGGRFSSRDKAGDKNVKPQPRPAKTDEPGAKEKQAVQTGNQAVPEKKRAVHPVKKETGPDSKPYRHRPERRFKKYDKEGKVKAAQGGLPAAPEPKPKSISYPPAAPPAQTGPKETKEKRGILKRLLGFLKKS